VAAGRKATPVTAERKAVSVAARRKAISLHKSNSWMRCGTYNPFVIGFTLP
jgi:hypothetical protein